MQNIPSGYPSIGQAVSGTESKLIDWKSKTSARILNEAEFSKLKEQHGLHVVGVAGFSGQWSNAKISADPELAKTVSDATTALRHHLSELKKQHGDSLVVSSGATMEGVPKLIYELCDELGIKAMGVTSNKAIDYDLGKMSYLIPFGEDWGAESPTFLRTSDEFLVLGGGGQAGREAKAAAQEHHKTVTVFQGFGGTSDQLQSSDLPGAQFVQRGQPMQFATSFESDEARTQRVAKNLKNQVQSGLEDVAAGRVETFGWNEPQYLNEIVQVNGLRDPVTNEALTAWVSPGGNFWTAEFPKGNWTWNMLKDQFPKGEFPLKEIRALQTIVNASVTEPKSL